MSHARLTVASTDPTKHLWTACASVLLPKCFVSKDTLRGDFILAILVSLVNFVCPGKEPSYGPRMLERYYRHNSVLFLVVVTVVGGLTSNLLLRYSTVQYSTVQYSTVPCCCSASPHPPTSASTAATFPSSHTPRSARSDSHFNLCGV